MPLYLLVLLRNHLAGAIPEGIGILLYPLESCQLLLGLHELPSQPHDLWPVVYLGAQAMAKLAGELPVCLLVLLLQVGRGLGPGDAMRFSKGPVVLRAGLSSIMSLDLSPLSLLYLLCQSLSVCCLLGLGLSDANQHPLTMLLLGSSLVCPYVLYTLQSLLFLGLPLSRLSLWP